ncbi:LysR family transcriptional regulator [Neptuniibacter sp. CAU 1671]|uniref:LysR family transcriptional regulator n=1 Tax=Neptuniibacter sp. CAU 1671 TaxID=3032593 RepID=UPI0023DBD8AC|nr:LysR family transcriptional regulator [Neptuniibacter sp. CAU 1671]MDF2180451.1 LysR family transcriptional regulator [Neptuniibacter sp. CAU 1671]
MYSPITLDALRTLDAISRHETFAGAAEELFRVPSAISYTIKKLESDLGLELFDRTHRRAVLTPAGQLVLEHGRKILLATEELTTMARQAALGWEINITLGIDTLFEADPLYELIAEFQIMHPSTSVEVVEEVLGGGWDAVNAGRCDLFIGAEGQPPGPGYEAHPMGSVEFVMAVAANHPLAQIAGPVSAEDIHAYPTVVIADSSRNLPVRSVGLLDGRAQITVPNLQKKLEVQLKGMGVGYLPLFRIKNHLAAGELKILQYEQAREKHSFSLAWRKQTMGQGLQWFLTKLIEHSARFIV